MSLGDFGFIRDVQVAPEAPHVVGEELPFLSSKKRYINMQAGHVYCVELWIKRKIRLSFIKVICVMASYLYQNLSEISSFLVGILIFRCGRKMKTVIKKTLRNLKSSLEM